MGMRSVKGFTLGNFLTVKLLLLLAVRKQELTAAKVAEFDLDKAIRYRPKHQKATRHKNKCSGKLSEIFEAFFHRNQFARKLLIALMRQAACFLPTRH